MKASTAKASGAVFGAIALAGMGVASVTPYAGDAVAAPVADEAASPLLARQAAASAGVQSVSNVEGSFSYDQGSLSSTSYIAEVFNKAAASLCASLPDYGIVQGSPRVTVDAASFAAFAVRAASGP